MTLFVAQMLLDNDVLTPSPIALIFFFLLMLLAGALILSLLVMCSHEIVLELYSFFGCNSLLFELFLHCLFFFLHAGVLSDLCDSAS